MGLTSMGTRCHAAALDSGNTAPESSHNGISSRFTMAWKPCVESNRQAITKPSPVTQKASKRDGTQRERDASTGVSGRPDERGQHQQQRRLHHAPASCRSPAC